MIIHTRALLTLLAIMACAEGVLVPLKTTPSPTTRLNDVTTSPPEYHASTRPLMFPTINDVTPHPSTGASPSTTNDVTGTTEEPHPPIHSTFFTTDATTDSKLMTLPENETSSRLLFWPPSAGINVTLNLTLSQRNHTFTVTTALPQHWHSIDIYQPTVGQLRARVDLLTERRHLNFEYTRVLHVQVGSDHPTHWCFCPRPYLCTLLSPLRDDDGSSRERTDLLVALVVVVFLFIVTLLALGGVIFYKKSELFHIYAKPVDCLPYVPPPPLPKPNSKPARYVERNAETKQVEAEKIPAKTDQHDDSEYSRVGGERGNNTAHPSPLITAPASDPSCKQQNYESINSLYGLV